jgi:hypothetical protein
LSLVRNEEEPNLENWPKNILQKLCELCVHPIASSGRAAVFCCRLFEAGFDPSQLGSGASSTPRIEELLVSQDVGKGRQCGRKAHGEVVFQQRLRRSNE